MLGPEIRTFREKQGITLEELSERTGISLARLHELENGEGIDVIVTMPTDTGYVHDVNPEYRRMLDALDATFGSDMSVRPARQ